MEENAQVMPQGKAYQQYFENTENTSSKTTCAQKVNVVFNFIDVTCRLNSSKLKTLFTSNHEEADTKIVYC